MPLYLYLFIIPLFNLSSSYQGDSYSIRNDPQDNMNISIDMRFFVTMLIFLLVFYT